MSGLETAIRSALARSDRSNAEIRARIYQSARQALETGLRKQDVHDSEVIAVQRHRLEETIHAIEGEERARLHAPSAERVQSAPSGDGPRAVSGSVEQSAPSGEDALDGLSASRTAPRTAGEDLGSMRAERRDRPVSSGKQQRAPSLPGDGTVDVLPEKAVRPRRRRRGFYARLFVFSVLFAAILMGVWWVYTSGLLKTAAERDTSVANPPASTQDEDFNGQTQADVAAQAPGLKTLGPKAGFSDEWLQVFKPADISLMTARPNARLEVADNGDGQVAHITSLSGDADGTVGVEIPAAILSQIGGKRSTIALTLRAGTAKPTQIYVECSFGSLGECGRHRFMATEERSEALFQVSFDRAPAPGETGHLLINSDIESKGRPVNLYSIRLLPGQ